RSGEKRKGVMDAATVNEVENRLRGEGLSQTKVKKAGGLNLDINLAFGGVPPKDLQIFTRQLATMIDAGLPLVQCLDILANQQPNKQFMKVLQSVKSTVEQGSTFSEALKRHPKVFDD